MRPERETFSSPADQPVEVENAPPTSDNEPQNDGVGPLQESEMGIDIGKMTIELQHSGLIIPVMTQAEVVVAGDNRGARPT